MKKNYLYTKLILFITIISLTIACSSKEDSNLLPNPETPTEPEPKDYFPLEVTDGVVTGVAKGYANIVFPSVVKRIQKNAFSENTDIRKVTLNEGLETIEEDAFFFSSVSEINFPSSLKEVGKYAFYGCKSLISADLSHTKVTSLPEGVFGLSDVESVTLPITLKEIGAQTFLSTPKLTNIEIPVNVKSLGNEAFRESGIVFVYLPNNLSFIDQRAFYYCPNLQQVKTHGTIKEENPNGSIQAYCFEGCPELATFEIPQNIRSIGQGMFGGNQKVESITIPINVNYIAFSAFNNTNIKNVVVESASIPAVGLVADAYWYGFPQNVNSIKVPTGKAEQYKVAPGWKEFADKIQ